MEDSSPNIRHRQEYMGLMYNQIRTQVAKEIVHLVCLQHHPHIGVEDILLGPHSVEVWVAGVAGLAHHGQADTGEVGQGPGLVADQVTPWGKLIKTWTYQPMILLSP